MFLCFLTIILAQVCSFPETVSVSENRLASPMMTMTSNFVDKETLTPTLSHYSRFWWRGSGLGLVSDVTTNTLTSKDHVYWYLLLLTECVIRSLVCRCGQDGDHMIRDTLRLDRHTKRGLQEVSKLLDVSCCNFFYLSRSSRSWLSTVLVFSWIWIWSTSMHPPWQ